MGPQRDGRGGPTRNQEGNAPGMARPRTTRPPLAASNAKRPGASRRDPPRSGGATAGRAAQWADRGDICLNSEHSPLGVGRRYPEKLSTAAGCRLCRKVSPEANILHGDGTVLISPVSVSMIVRVGIFRGAWARSSARKRARRASVGRSDSEGESLRSDFGVLFLVYFPVSAFRLRKVKLDFCLLIRSIMTIWLFWGDRVGFRSEGER